MWEAHFRQRNHRKVWIQKSNTRFCVCVCVSFKMQLNWKSHFKQCSNGNIPEAKSIRKHETEIEKFKVFSAAAAADAGGVFSHVSFCIEPNFPYSPVYVCVQVNVNANSISIFLTSLTGKVVRTRLKT